MLIEQINLFPDNDTLWFYQGQTVIAIDFKRFWNSAKSFRKSIHGKKVALHLSSPLDTARALCLLDGTAESILLLPTEQNSDDIANFVKTTGCSSLLTDNASLGNVMPEDVSIVTVSQLEHEQHNEAPVESDEMLSKLASNWIIPTSGTTGVPKLVSHSIQSLTRSVRTNRAVGREYTWGLLYGLMRFAGLQVFLQCLYSGSSLVLLKGSETTDDALSQLASAGCNALSATPTMWRKILMFEHHRQLKLRQITLGGESVDQQVLNALGAAFSGSRIVHIYASTEAGVGFAVTDGKEGFPDSYLTSPPSGVKIKVDNEGFLLLKPEILNQSYIGIKEKLKQDDGYINTGDVVKLEDGRYLFLGRANGAINVGGNKVQPEEVEKVMRSFACVKLVSVYAKPSPIMGDLVAADVVVDNSVEDKKSFRKALVEHCRSQLASHKVPAVIKFTDDIKLNHTGKILRS
ncbi:ANL family adenylate-forming protein [Vibrio penaeicida]|uniref:ANL family adenylate-forming protein n=1 Tax=Vibrio penaeicida TaxID=104609 RepID=UPI000CE9EFB0|nr:fatty acid--CoA ligase family protein [Vibrio penaeicida]